VFEKARIGLNVKQIVDGHNLECVRVTLHRRFDDLATDPSKSVNSYFQHIAYPPF
jgi:hypothetical protein